MFHRAVLLMTMALAVLALAVTPAFAGEEPDPTAAPPAQPAPTAPAPAPVSVVHGSAKLRTSQCVVANRAKASVSGTSITSVAFFVDGKKVKTVSSPDASGNFTFTMSCSHLSVGTHRARAAVSFQSGATPTSKTLMFQITRSTATSPQFAG